MDKIGIVPLTIFILRKEISKRETTGIILYHVKFNLKNVGLKTGFKKPQSSSVPLNQWKTSLFRFLKKWHKRYLMLN